MYEKMFESRTFEERIKEAYFEGKTPLFNMANGPIRARCIYPMNSLCSWRVPTPCLATLLPLPIGRIISRLPKALTSKQWQRKFRCKTGLAGGRGGHMHLFDPNVNFSCSGILPGPWPRRGRSALVRAAG